jgi:DNA replication protein DnaC
VLEQINQHCKQLRLPTLAQVVPETLTLAQQQEWSLEQFLLTLLEQELDQRGQRRIDRLLREARLPPAKPWPSSTRPACPYVSAAKFPG